MFLEEFDFEIDNEGVIIEDVDFKIDIRRLETLGKVNDYFIAKYVFVTNDSISCVSSDLRNDKYHMVCKLYNGVVISLDIPREEYEKVEKAYR